MVVALKSLRVDASFDASGYARGAADLVAANERMIGSERARGAALANADAQLQKAIPGVTALSRSFITGYGSGAQFENALRRIGNAVDRGMGLDRAQVLLEGVYRKFGLTADAAALAGRGQSALLPIVTELNSRYAAQSAILERNSLAARRMAEAQQYQAQINARLGVNDNIPGAGRATDIAAYGKSLDDLRAKYNPLFAAGRGYRDQLAEINQAYRVGAFGAIGSARAEQERAEAIMSTKAAFVQQVNAMRPGRDALAANDNAANSAAGSFKKLSFESRNLGFQIIDVTQQAIAGQSAFMILAQQGGQLAQIFAFSSVSIGTMLRQLGGAFAVLLRPAVLAFGGIATLIGTAVAALFSYASAQREVERSLTGIGRASGVTVGDINAIASQGASPLGLSVSEARETATALAAVGKIGKDAIAPLVGLAHDFAKTLGLDSAEAAKQLAQAFSDPIRGADTLNERLGFMDAAMQRQIRNLVEQNRLVEAQMLMVHAVESSIAKANTVTGFWSQTWNAISNAISNAYDGLGRILARASGVGLTLDEQLERAKRRLEDLRSQRDGVDAAGYITLAPKQEEIRAAETDVARLANEIERAAQAAQEAKTRLESLRISDAIRGFLPEIDALQKLINQEMVVGGAAEDPVMLRALGLTQSQVDRAKSIISDLRATFKTAFQEIQSQAAISFDAITAFSPSEKAAIARREAEAQFRTRTDLSPNEKAILAEAAALRVLKQITTELAQAQRERVLTAQQAVQAAELDVRLIGESIGEQERMRAELQAEQDLRREAATRRIPFDQAKLDDLKAQIALPATLRRRTPKEDVAKPANDNERKHELGTGSAAA